MEEEYTLQEFIDKDLIPALHNGGIAEAFPNIHFERRGSKWGANYYLKGTKHSNPKKWDKIWTSDKCPFVIHEQGGDTISLIKFYQELTGVKWIDAVKALSSACGLTPPEKEQSESQKRFNKKQEEFEEIATLMKKELFSNEGAATLEYLKSRGYNDEFIEFAEFGYCSATTASKLRSILKKYEDDRPTYLSYDVGKINIFALPYRSKGKIQGFVFRRIDGEKSGKYKDVFISGKANKSYNLFGLTGLSLSGKRDIDRDLTIVEGEIDALRASFCGVPNVVAASGSSINTEALLEAKKKGVLRITILFDSEDTEEEQVKTYNKIEDSVKAIKSVGLEAYVATFGEWNSPEGDRVKMDSDTYLSFYSGEELSHLIKYSAITGSLWRYNRLFQKYAKKEEDGGEERIAETDFSDFRREVIALCREYRDGFRADFDRLTAEFHTTTGGLISEETLKEEAEKELQERKRLQSISEAKQITQKINTLCEQGKIEEAIALGKKLSNLSEHYKEAEYSATAKPISLSGVKERYKNRPSGISTGYYFTTEDNKPIELIIPSAALTYVCAKTSHGKTTFLQNLALKTAQSEERVGDVVFITFEESEEDIATEFLTRYCGEPLSGNTLRSIRSYYEGKENPHKADGSYFDGNNLSKFKQKESEFDELLKSYKLRIYKRKNTLSDLTGFIKYLNSSYKIKAVFVDYIQRIQSPEVRGEKKRVMEAVCDELMNVSLSTGLPVVLGAQLNRQALSPVEMGVENIADASDIEHSAHVIILLWNSEQKPLPTSTKYFTDSKRETFSEEAQKIESRGFHIGQRGTLYAILSKNRGGEKGTAVFNFNGNSRAITQLSPSISEIPQQQTTYKPKPQENSLPFEAPVDGVYETF